MVKLKIQRCLAPDEKGATSSDGSKPFVAMINPSGYETGLTINYSTDTAIGKGTPARKFDKRQPESVTLGELVLDGTGVVSQGVEVSVKGEIAKLQDVALKPYPPKGALPATDEPPVVEVYWGSLLGQFRLEALKIKYTLFKPTGEPLRAKLTLTLQKYVPVDTTANAAAAAASGQQVVDVKAGDTLPAICEASGGGASNYLAVARANNLTTFRDLPPGSRLMVSGSPMARA